MDRRKNYRFTIWLQGPIGRGLERVLWRFPPWKNWTAKKVWAEMARDEGWQTEMREAMEDLKAGRRYRVVDYEFIPDDSWKPGDPVQPDGWHHDGEKWVRDDPTP